MEKKLNSHLYLPIYLAYLKCLRECSYSVDNFNSALIGINCYFILKMISGPFRRCKIFIKTLGNYQ